MPAQVRRRAKLALAPDQVAMLLGLPPGQRVVRMWTVDDPHRLWVYLEGDGLPESTVDIEAHVLCVDGWVRDGETHLAIIG